MKAIFYFLFLSLAITGCKKEETHNQKVEKNEPHIVYSLKEDGRAWKVGHEDKNEQASITEYVLENETTQNWSELITVHYFKDLDVSPKVYWDLFKEELQKNAGEHKVNTKVISEDANSVFGEWWIQDSSQTDQHEWIKIFVKGKDLAILRYTTKDLKNVEANRKKWEHIIGASKFE